jgi:hypothetical protein
MYIALCIVLHFSIKAKSRCVSCFPRRFLESDNIKLRLLLTLLKKQRQWLPLSCIGTYFLDCTNVKLSVYISFR